MGRPVLLLELVPPLTPLTGHPSSGSVGVHGVSVSRQAPWRPTTADGRKHSADPARPSAPAARRVIAVMVGTDPEAAYP